MKYSNFEVTKAINIRENFKLLFDFYHDEGDVLEILGCWAQDSMHMCINEMNKVVSTFTRHSSGIVNSFISVINNAMASRLNWKIPN
ncbi:MAG: transposase [Breznakibacter sp.]